MIFLVAVEIPLLNDVVIILAVAVAVIMLLSRLKLPTIIGFLISGIISGPHGLHLIKTDAEVEFLAEIGVILLLFTIGLEFSVRNLLKVRKAIFIGGIIQVFLSILVFAGISYLSLYEWLPIAVFIGFLFALSSTAIVLKVMQATGEIRKPHGQVVLAILIFQDLIIVPMMLAVPIMTGASENVTEELLMMGLKLLVIGVVLILCARYVVPWLLYQITLTRSKDLFIVTVVVMCFAIAWMTSMSGLSLALGAFLAGLVISESEYSHEAAGNVLPFKEIFTSIFFISVGMLMDIRFLIDHILEVIGLTLLVMLIKAAVAMLAAAALRVNLRTIIPVGLAICQIGEFSFVLAKTGTKYGLLPIEVNQYFLSVAIMTMIITPVLLKFQTKITGFILEKMPGSQRFKRKITGKPVKAHSFNLEDKDALKDHLLIIGFGPSGRRIARGAQNVELPYVIIEQNPKTVKEEAKKHEPIIYGDAMTDEVSHHAAAEKASAIVITVPNLEVVKALTHHFRSINKEALILTRTSFVADAQKIKKEGADVVVIDELESNTEMIVNLLDHFTFPVEEINKFIYAMRTEEEAEKEYSE